MENPHSPFSVMHVWKIKQNKNNNNNNDDNNNSKTIN